MTCTALCEGRATKAESVQPCGPLAEAVQRIPPQAGARVPRPGPAAPAPQGRPKPRLLPGDRFKTPTKAAADLGRLLIPGHQNAVRTVEGHQLPLFLHHLPAQDLPKGAARIHEEEPVIPIRHVSRAIHGEPLSRQGRRGRFSGGWPITGAALRARPAALAPVGQGVDSPAPLTEKLSLPAQLSAAFDDHRPPCR